jgi:hypothetical protein
VATEERPQHKKTQTDLLDELHPVFKVRVISILETLRRKHWQPKIVFAKRTEEQQRDAVRRKASPTMLSWHVRSTIGMMPVPNTVAMAQVVHGNAVDIVDERYGWEGLAANKGGSAQESERGVILRGFLKNDELGPGRGHALGFEQEVA